METVGYDQDHMANFPTIWNTQTLKYVAVNYGTDKAGNLHGIIQEIRAKLGVIE